MKKRFNCIGEKELNRLNSGISSERDRLLFEILYETGCYVKELVSIKIKDVDFRKGSIKFNEKNSKISAGLCGKLKSFAKNKSGFIFATSQSDKMTSKRARQLIHKYTKDILGEKLNPKSIRYGHFMDAFSKNVPLEDIQKQTGAGNLRLRQINKELSPGFDLSKGISFFIIGIALLFLSFYFISFVRTEFSGYAIYENYTIVLSSAIACDYSHCPLDATSKVAYNDKKYVRIKTKEILLKCESDAECKDECDIEKKLCEADCVAANLTKHQEDECKGECEDAKHLCEDECSEESKASCKEWYFGYLNISWSSPVPSNATIVSAKAIIKHKVKGKYADSLLRIWDYNLSSFVTVADLNESGKWILSEADLSSYVKSPGDINNLLLQYYLWSDAAGKAEAKIGWVSISINYTTSDVIPPSVSYVVPAAGSMLLQNSTARISANVTDNSAVDKVLANISWSNYSQTIELINGLNSVYAGNFTNTSYAGIYYVRIIANDSFGNINNTSTTWFNISAAVNTPPSKVILLSPLSGNITLNRNPTFVWNKSTDYENNSLTYQILIANSTNFTSLIANASVNITNYTSPELPTDIALYWKVRAYDGYIYGNFSDIWNLTVQSSLIVSLPINTVDFGNIKPGESNDTLDNSPYPLIVQNDGNIIADIIVKGSDLWIRKLNPSLYYQYKIGINESNSFNLLLSTINWTFMPTSNSIVDIADLKYTDESDTARIDLNITAASDEPAGARNSTITITAEAA